MVSHKEIKQRLEEKNRGLSGRNGLAEIFCPECGVRNPSAAKFCSRCGSTIEIIGKSPIEKEYGYLFCDTCHTYHKLASNESYEDYARCECGGNLIFTKDLEQIEIPTKTCDLCGAINFESAIRCNECGRESEEYLLYLESKKKDIEITRDLLKVYHKQDRKIRAVKEYKRDEIYNLRFVNKLMQSALEFDYGDEHFSSKLTSRQAKYAKKELLSTNPPVLTCPNIECEYNKYLKKDQNCPLCGQKSDKIDYDYYKTLEELKIRKSQEKRIKRNEELKKQRYEKLREKERNEREAIEKERMQYGYLKYAKGIDGELELYKHKIRIRKGFMALAATKPKSEKEIMIKEISSIRFKKATPSSSGHIKFTFPGADESRKGLFQAPHHENIIRFNHRQQMAFEQIKEMIEARTIVQKGINIVETEKTNLDELEKLAELKEKGIITKEEFETKKKDILGL